MTTVHGIKRKYKLCDFVEKINLYTYTNALYTSMFYFWP